MCWYRIWSRNYNWISKSHIVPIGPAIGAAGACKGKKPACNVLH